MEEAFPELMAEHWTDVFVPSAKAEPDGGLHDCDLIASKPPATAV